MFVKMFVRGTEFDQFGALDVILTIAPGASNKKRYLRTRYLHTSSCGRYRFTFIKPTALAIVEIRRQRFRWLNPFAPNSSLIRITTREFTCEHYNMLIALFFMRHTKCIYLYIYLSMYLPIYLRKKRRYIWRLF